MGTSPLLENSAALQREAREVLELTGIEAVLERFGQVNLIGSYRYGVMVRKDIDFHIIVDAMTTKLVQDFFAYASGAVLFEHILFHDKHTFNALAAARYASKWALDSYYFGLRLTHGTSEWQIGVNFITAPQQSSVEIGHLFETATDAQRERIISFKQALIDDGRSISSAYIYRAVLEKDITDMPSLLAYLRSIGYSL